MPHTILLAGATGMLGSRIAVHLLKQPDARLRLLVRALNDPKLRGLQGAELVEGDLADPASLDRATDGAEVVVSAVQGGREVIVDGQIALAHAARRNGARHILPSDYALDLFKATPGESPSYDARREADAGIADVGLAQVNVLQGAFMEMLLPGRGAIDLQAGTVSFYGDGERPVEVTSVEDTARMIVRVVLDPDVPAGKFAFAGDRVSIRQAGEIVGARIGRSLRPVSLGSEDDLRKAMAAADAQKRTMLAYLLYMLNGQAALSDLQNGRYPNLKLEGFADFAARTAASTAPQ